jgi:hypothetical protein
MQRRDFLISVSAFPLVASFLTGCGDTDDIEAALNTLSSLSASAVGVVSGLNWGDDAAKKLIIGSLQTFSAGCTAASADLKAGTLTPVQIAALISQLSGAIIANLPATVPALVMVVLSAAQAAAVAVISILQSQQPATAAPGSQSVPVKVHFTKEQAQSVKDATAKLQTAVANLKASAH